MKKGNTQTILIIVIVVLLLCSIGFTVYKHIQRNKNVLKNTNVTVTVNMEDEENGEEENLDDSELAAKTETDVADEEVYDVNSAFDVTGTDTTENVIDNSSEATTDETSELEELYFGYDSIDSSNYVNFIEQLCSVDFNGSVDTSVIPISDTLREKLESQGCVNQDALTHSFVTNDKGFNDSDNTFFVIIHIPNGDFVLIQGAIEDNVLVTLNTEVMG
jgi:hypothetical protein